MKIILDKFMLIMLIYLLIKDLNKNCEKDKINKVKTYRETNI